MCVIIMFLQLRNRINTVTVLQLVLMVLLTRLRKTVVGSSRCHQTTTYVQVEDLYNTSSSTRTQTVYPNNLSPGPFGLSPMVTRSGRPVRIAYRSDGALIAWFLSKQLADARSRGHASLGIVIS
jgi:hypothetical protein